MTTGLPTQFDLDTLPDPATLPDNIPVEYDRWADDGLPWGCVDCGDDD